MEPIDPVVVVLVVQVNVHQADVDVATGEPVHHEADDKHGFDGHVYVFD